jgi:hypothetical protein
MAKQVDGRDHGERMDENRACDGACGNQQWKQDRELMILRHLPTVGIPHSPPM